MKYLIIDTSTYSYGIGIGDENGLICSYNYPNLDKFRKKDLLSEIDKLLKRRNLSPNDLSGVIAYLGPGSYTGLRIGITVANTFAYSLNIPIVGVQGNNLTDNKFEISEMSPQNMGELLQKGLSLMSKAKVGNYVTPFYGREANVG